MWPRGDARQQVAILTDRLKNVEVALVEAYANREPANVDLCRDRLKELTDELDRLLPRPRGSE